MVGSIFKKVKVIPWIMLLLDSSIMHDIKKIIEKPSGNESKVRSGQLESFGSNRFSFFEQDLDNDFRMW